LFEKRLSGPESTLRVIGNLGGEERQLLAQQQNCFGFEAGDKKEAKEFKVKPQIRPEIPEPDSPEMLPDSEDEQPSKAPHQSHIKSRCPDREMS